MSLGRIINPFDNVIYNGDANRLVFHDMTWAPNAAGAAAAGDNPVWALEGTNAADADCIGAVDGGWRLYADGGSPTADDEVCLIMNTATGAAGNALVQTVADKPAMTCVFTTGSALTETQIFIGLGSDDNADAMFDCGDGEVDAANLGATSTVVGITYDTDDSDTQFRYVVKDTATATASRTEGDIGLTVEADTTYELAVWIDDSNKAHVMIQKQGSADPYFYNESTAFTSSTDVIGPFCGLSFLSTASKDLFVRDIKFAVNHDN